MWIMLAAVLAFVSPSESSTISSLRIVGRVMYPHIAKAAGVEGRVAVKVTTDAKGKVTKAVAESGHPMLVKSAEDNARSLQFGSADNPESRETTVTMVYRLADNGCATQNDCTLAFLDAPTTITVVGMPMCVQVQRSR